MGSSETIKERPNRIVYVDDDFDIRQIVRASFEMEDDGKLVVATCGSGSELISRLRELQPNLILLDLHMPEMDGPDVIDALRKNKDGEDVPIIFLTGDTKLVMEAHYKSLGVIGIIYKPFEPDQLLPEINKIWEKAYGPTDGDGGDGRVLSELMDDEEAEVLSTEKVGERIN